jgi:hypothetical protein
MTRGTMRTKRAAARPPLEMPVALRRDSYSEPTEVAT